ncbi:unnamed protein product [Meganyctiphanes norvegica]|uniref:Uncharacterized protein n=1 Tax=Meganyctiphanes norvegica TaxID=48144 RepID=A0AAV2REM5_MEGNR
MFKILFICPLACLTFVLAYGSQSDKIYKPCPIRHRAVLANNCTVEKIQSQGECQTYLNTTKGGNYFLYLKPLITGQMCISLHKEYSDSSTPDITCDLFTHTLNDSNIWYKINIKSSYHYTNANSEYNEYQYSMSMELNGIITDTNNLTVQSLSQTDPDQIQVETVTSLWSFNCDPRQHCIKLHPAPEPEPEQEPEPAYRPVPKPTSGPEPEQEPEPAYKPKSVSEPEPEPEQEPIPEYQPVHRSTTGPAYQPVPKPASFHIRGWMVSIIAAIILVLTLLVIQIRRQFKNRNCDPSLIQPTDDESRLSQEGYENSV